MSPVPSLNAVMQQGLQHANANGLPLHNQRFMDTLAGMLSVEPSQLSDAISQASDAGANGKKLLAAVAAKLNVSVDDLAKAIDDTRKAQRGHGHVQHANHRRTELPEPASTQAASQINLTA